MPAFLGKPFGGCDGLSLQDCCGLAARRSFAKICRPPADADLGDAGWEDRVSDPGRSCEAAERAGGGEAPKRRRFCSWVWLWLGGFPQAVALKRVSSMNIEED